MKKIILFLIALVSLQSILAQSISFTTRLTKGQGPNSFFQIEAKTNLTNNSNDTLFEWVVLDITAPTEWEFGLCDPGNCIPGLKVGSKFIFVLAKGASGEFKGDFVLNNKAGNGSAKIAAYSLSNPTVTDTLEFQMSAWPTGIREVRANKELSFFPNPAKDKLTVRYNTRETILIDVYNMLGSKVKTVAHNGQETDINISDLQNGVYFLRFKDNNQTVSRPFTKSE